MILGVRRPVALVNGCVVTPHGPAASLRFTSRVLSVDEPAKRGDTVVDLDGAFVLPGFINAHEHLELNHYGPLKRRERYENAAQWINDLRPALKDNAAIRRNTAFPLRDRLFIGGLKNLLAGVTTVAHHNPLYPEIDGHFPVRVMKGFGWAHSFGLEGKPVGANGEPGASVREASEKTPGRAPFIVHAGEGTDDAASDELWRLAELGCLKHNTVLVHGVALTTSTWKLLQTAGASLVWCPASNRFLFDRTAPVRELLDAAADSWAHICLGTDARITGSRDLLDEMREAAIATRVTPRELLRMVTTAAAGILRLPQAGRLAVNGPADLVVVPPSHVEPAEAVLASRREHIRLVAIGGRPMVAAREFEPIFSARRRKHTVMRVDGVERLFDAAVARRIQRCPIAEPGVAGLQVEARS